MHTQGQRGVTVQRYEEKLKLARKVTENFENLSIKTLLISASSVTVLLTTSRFASMVLATSVQPLLVGTIN